MKHLQYREFITKGGYMEELVYLKNDEAVCSSLQVSEKFGKRHDNVMQSIRGLLKNEETHEMFKKSSYIEEQNNQRYPMYLMNRDGFSLLVMGFTGKKALDWKLQYIKAFNQMESFIREKSTQTWVETRKYGKLTRKAETDTIQKLVEYAKEQGSGHAEMLYMTYSKLANKMAGVKNRDEATVKQLNDLSLMENIILHEIDLGIMKGKHYKEIYKDCKNRLETVKDLAYLEIA
jgi:Rha family phage regulatory protein